MKIIYHLSNRQMKELILRGLPLQIALPIPPIEIDDLADWARSMLPSELREYVRAAREDEIRVEPGSGGDGLTGIIGQIRGEEYRSWTVPVAVIIVQLASGSTRHAASAVQWPADVLIDGVSLVERRKTGLRPHTYTKSTTPSI